MAWSQLGTAERMARLGRWMKQAEELACTSIEKERVGLWKTGLWQWMEEGRTDYVAKQAEKSASR